MTIGGESSVPNARRDGQLAARMAASQLAVMDAPLIATSARKHGIHDDYLIHAFDHPVFVDDPADGFTMFVGADTSGNLLEVGVIDSVVGPIDHPRHAGLDRSTSGDSHAQNRTRNPRQR